MASLIEGQTEPELDFCRGLLSVLGTVSFAFLSNFSKEASRTIYNRFFTKWFHYYKYAVISSLYWRLDVILQHTKATCEWVCITAETALIHLQVSLSVLSSLTILQLLYMRQELSSSPERAGHPFPVQSHGLGLGAPSHSAANVPVHAEGPGLMKPFNDWVYGLNRCQPVELFPLYSRL